MNEEKNDSIRRAIMAEVKARGPDTSILLAERLKLPQDSVWKRCSELIQAGLLVRQGRKENPSGRQASLLGLGEHADAWLSGLLDLKVLTTVTVKERLGRVLKAAREVARAGRAQGEGVVVPMELMVTLSVALQRHDEQVRGDQDAVIAGGARHG